MEGVERACLHCRGASRSKRRRAAMQRPCALGGVELSACAAQGIAQCAVCRELGAESSARIGQTSVPAQCRELGVQ
jgi:hypothetical protein